MLVCVCCPVLQHTSLTPFFALKCTYSPSQRHSLFFFLPLSYHTHTHTLSHSLAVPFWSMEIIYLCHEAWFPICYWDPEQLDREEAGGRDGGIEEKEREERQLERLPTAGNQFPVRELTWEQWEGIERKRDFSKQERKWRGKRRCQPVCLLRLAPAKVEPAAGSDP